jgi:hypothetical protein
MDEEQKYLFDINGYLLLRGVLAPAEVAPRAPGTSSSYIQLYTQKGV